jgi:hypothetical protein
MKTMSKQSKQVNSKSKTVTVNASVAANNGAATGCDHEEVCQLAFSYWQARGCPKGSPEDDWFRAEHELSSRAVSAPVKRSKAQQMAASN